MRLTLHHWTANGLRAQPVIPLNGVALHPRNARQNWESNKMEIRKLCIAWLTLTLSISSIGQNTASPTPTSTAHVKGHGCVKPGNVSDCVVVNDYKAHRKYNVFFLSGEKPDLNTGMSFEGLGYGHTD